MCPPAYLFRISNAVQQKYTRHSTFYLGNASHSAGSRYAKCMIGGYIAIHGGDIDIPLFFFLRHQLLTHQGYCSLSKGLNLTPGEVWPLRYFVFDRYSLKINTWLRSTISLRCLDIWSLARSLFLFLCRSSTITSGLLDQAIHSFLGGSVQDTSRLIHES
jgi:hypothetical protein